jgi:hypothetical protein
MRPKRWGPSGYVRALVVATRLLLPCTLVLAPAGGQGQRVAQPPAARANTDSLTTAQFARLVARLSDAGGSFDTDNLISNEASLLHPIPQLIAQRVRGGVYVGVGPDQNFNYIAQVAPQLAIIADIRRDNLLHHLLFKALFAASTTRAEFLALWLGRELDRSTAQWRDASVDSLVAWAARTPATAASATAARRAVQERVRSFGLPLTERDLATIARFHDAFIRDGVSLRFTSTGRAPRDYYPTLGSLLRERDTQGVQRSYLASDTAFRVVQSLHRRNLIVPVVGDLSGGVLDRVGDVMRERGTALSVLYTSNVEDYLIRDGRFAAYVNAVRRLPRTPQAVIIRSWFGGPGSHPLNVPGYHTTQLLEPVTQFSSDASVVQLRRYRDLVARIQ